MTSSVVCSKRTFISRREAKAMLHSAQERNVAHRAECRTYKCDNCHLYHLTSMPLAEYEAKKALEDTINLN